MKSYRAGFLVALAGNIALALVAAGLWWQGRTQRPAPAAAPHVAETPAPEAAPAETPLAPVQISPQRLQSIGVATGEVTSKVVEDRINTTGNVSVDETRLAYVQTRYAGYIEKVFADATYLYVRKGQPLFTVYSPEVAATEREYLVARQNSRQVASSTVPGVAAGAASLLDAATQRLKQFGVPPSEIARLESTGQASQELEVDSPVAGFITERNALPTVAVQPEMRLYTIADLSTVWVQGQLFQNDLARVKPGDPATLTADTFPGRTFHGQVDFLYPQVDTETRTARVRIVFSNPGLQLKPGMFVNVALRVPLGRQLVVPYGAVLQAGARQLAFVDRGGGYLDPREVQTGARVGDDLIVLKGLAAGERVVTSANFLIDSESQLQAAMGAFAPPPPGAGAAAANATQAHVELTTNPDPPRKGQNLFTVKITDPSGAPVTGAMVHISFSMPAMPAMGMAAMRTDVDLSEKGSGLYEGSGQLGSGGTWQVTILARKNGQTIARRQLSVSAAGGM